MSIGLGFKRKAGEVGSAAYNKISNGNNDKITKKSTSIVSEPSSLLLDIKTIQPRTSLKMLKGEIKPEENSKSSNKREAENKDNSEGKSSKRKSIKPNRLMDEQANPAINNPKSVTLKQTKIEIYPCVDIPARDLRTGELYFKDFPYFRPNMTPKEVLQSGSFGGTYFRPIRSGVTGQSYKDVHTEFPEDWFEGLKLNKHVTSSTYLNEVNKYRVHCGGDLEMWESSGWISTIDPYGWFQWYCRFYLGRRCSDDERQVTRGLGVFGPTGRWRNNLANKIISAYPTDLQSGLEDYSISPVVRQLLQHWGYTMTLNDLEKAVKKKSRT